MIMLKVSLNEMILEKMREKAFQLAKKGLIHRLEWGFIAGLVSNIASIVTFLSADMRKQTFNQLLAILAAIDILWVFLLYLLLI